MSVPLSTLLPPFARIGLMSFGGPAAQIALMHKVLVDERGWLTERQFLNALSFCMLLPGPEAMQLATFAGWRLAGIGGGLLAGALFVLPGALVMLALAAGYATYGEVPLVSAVFLGIKAAVLVIVFQALLKIAARALARRAHWALAIAAFVALFFVALPYPLIVLAAAAIGAVLGGTRVEAAPPRLDLARTGLVLALGLALWLGPLFLLDGILAEIGMFFAKLAVVTFGGAYAVLAWVAQDAVTALGWMTPGEVLDGLGLAETTPGPLILVTQFVGFLAAFREGGLWLGAAGAGVALWATFVPCFLWIFAGAPYIDWISAQPRLSGALSGVTAAVVGVVANLSLWFGLHVFFGTVTQQGFGPLVLWVPDPATLDPVVVALAAVSAVLLLGLRVGLGWTLLAMAGLGLGASLI
ncbi:chromate efflux transporter [Maribius pontilimi]|uniref:Chromate efflux transporter n=1 Tax=Palleronia pontilimi TaxID=1964209 RepID=A0A934IF17_9RHOB|nr:chromate efflux transporter [Palleronia pontilimi]MBJ3761420.1 chromate efflux transporter [Palleronia pontilimi]